MDKFPLLLEGRPTGELICRRETGCVLFDLHCRLPEHGLWCAWAIGDQGELRLGALERTGELSSLRRRFSDRLTAPLGRLLRGELRPADAVPAKKAEPWAESSDPASLFQASWLRQRLQKPSNARYRREEGRLYLALPYDSRRAFPLTTLFCFAQVRTIEGGQWAVFAFDREENPIFP